jgi:hypothetical protein
MQLHHTRLKDDSFWLLYFVQESSLCLWLDDDTSSRLDARELQDARDCDEDTDDFTKPRDYTTSRRHALKTSVTGDTIRLVSVPFHLHTS